VIPWLRHIKTKRNLEERKNKKATSLTLINCFGWVWILWC